MVGVDVQQRGIPAVPVGEQLEDGDGHHHRRTDGQRHLDEGLKGLRAVQQRRFDQGVRHSGDEVVAQQHDVPGRAHARQDQRKIRVPQVQHLGVDHVGGHQAAREQHGDHQKQHQALAVLEFPAGKGIAAGAHDRQSQRRAAEGDQHGIEKRPGQRGARAGHHPEGFQGKLPWDEAIAIEAHARLGGQRRRDHQQHRQECQHDDDGKENDGKGVRPPVEGADRGCFARGVPFLHALASSHQRAVPVHAPDEGVGEKQQRAADRALQEGRRRGKAEIGLLHQRLVDVYIQGLRDLLQRP